MIRTVAATRYVTPLRQGGSLPAIVEADDDGMYVLKFRGAAQGTRPLIAELVAGELGRALGLPVPEIVFIELDPALGHAEPHAEIKALIKASAGLNVGLDYLPGALGYLPAGPAPEAGLASAVVWFDALITNVDRTARNPNMLVWHHKLWLIDHGAALYFHHAGGDYLPRSRDPFPQIAQHVLLPLVDGIPEIDATLSARIRPDLVNEIVSLIPESWLDDSSYQSADEHRAAYAAYLLSRVQPPRPFVETILDERARLV